MEKWYVMLEIDNFTVAICNSEEIANWIAENYIEKCIVRKSM